MTKINKCHTAKGFSLVEIMVAIAIVAIVAAIAIPAYNQYIKEAKEVTLEEALHEMHEIFKTYVVTHGKLPKTLDEVGIPKENVGLTFDYFDDDALNSGTVAATGNKLENARLVAHQGGTAGFVLSLDLDRKSKELSWTCAGAHYYFQRKKLPVSYATTNESLAPDHACSLYVDPMTLFMNKVSAHLAPPSQAKTCGDGWWNDPMDSSKCVKCGANQSAKVIAFPPAGEPVTACLDNCPPGTVYDGTGNCCASGDKDQNGICGTSSGSFTSVAASFQMPAGSVKTCPSGEELVSVPGGSYACTPACATGSKRDPADPANCIPDPASTNTGSPAANPKPAGSTTTGTTNPPAANTPPPGCPSGQIPDPSNSANCIPKPPAVGPEKTITGIPDDTTCPAGQLFVPNIPAGTQELKGPVTGNCKDAGLANQYYHGLSSGHYDSVQCQACDNLPPQICEFTHKPKTCNWPNNYCVNELTNNLDASRTVSRGCGNLQYVYDEWFLKYSDDDKCTDFDQKLVYTQAMTCSFACSGDNCNIKVNPDNTWTP